MAQATALVISTDPMTAALLGLLLQLEHYHAVFHEGEEAVAVVFDRVHPTLILVDVDHPDGFSEAFTIYAREAGARVLAFSPGRLREDVRDLAMARHLAWFALPIDRATFATALASA